MKPKYLDREKDELWKSTRMSWGQDPARGKQTEIWSQEDLPKANYQTLEFCAINIHFDEQHIEICFISMK